MRLQKSHYILVLCLLYATFVKAAAAEDFVRQWKRACDAGNLMMEAKDYAQAQRQYKISLALAERMGTNSKEAQMSLVLLEHSFVSGHKPQEAQPFFQKTLALARHLKATLSPELIIMMIDLADAYEKESYKQTTPETANLCTVYCIQLRDIADPDHERLSRAFCKLGSSYYNLKMYRDAETMIAMGVLHLDQKWGPKNTRSSMVKPLSELARIQEKRKELADAEASLTRARYINNLYLHPGFSTKELAEATTMKTVIESDLLRIKSEKARLPPALP